MCTDTPQRYLRRILVSDFKQTKRWPIIPSLRRCQCSPPPAYLSMCTDTPQRYLRRILILDFKQKNAGRPFSFQNRFSLLWQPCLRCIQVNGWLSQSKSQWMVTNCLQKSWRYRTGLISSFHSSTALKLPFFDRERNRRVKSTIVSRRQPIYGRESAAFVFFLLRSCSSFNLKTSLDPIRH